jgi:hypothetical protein
MWNYPCQAKKNEDGGGSNFKPFSNEGIDKTIRL